MNTEKNSERLLICSMIHDELDDGSPNAKFLRKLMECHEGLKPFYYEKNEKSELIVFYADKLQEMLDEFKFDSKVFETAEEVAAGKVHRCTGCHCGIYGPFPYTYRDNCSCVGRSYECYVCRGYDNIAFYEIYEHQKKYGTEKAIMKAIKADF